MTRARNRSGTARLARLTVAAERASTDLHALAADIVRVIDVLPKNTSSAARELLEQQGRRAKAIAAALQNELKAPDPATTQLLIRAGQTTAAAVIAASATVGVGIGEAAGGDLWAEMKARASGIARYDLDSTPHDPIAVICDHLGLTLTGLAKRSGVPEARLNKMAIGARSPRRHAEAIADLVNESQSHDAEVHQAVASLLDNSYP